MGLAIDLPEAVRSTDVEPVETKSTDLPSVVTAVVRRMLGARPGTVGVVSAAARLPEVATWFEGWTERQGGDQARLALLTGLDTKGLEFDGIVVVAPGEIEAESPTGRATLYVVLTRATQELTLVH